MTTPSTNLTFTAVQTELGGGGSISLSEYTRGGSIVNVNQTSPYGIIPSSNSNINMGVFRNVTKYVAAFSGTISSNQTNLNLRSWALSNGWNGSAAATITIAAVIIGSANVVSYALTISGSWPGGLTVINNGYILGAGGAGGNAHLGTTGGAGIFGGPAISVSTNVTFTNSGIIGGGGGGGGAGGDSNDSQGGLPGGGGGGGGAGYIVGAGGGAGTYDTTGTDGAAGGGLSAGSGGNGGTLYDVIYNVYIHGGTGGNGGGLGSAGSSGGYGDSPYPPYNTTPGAGGAGGHALDGKSYVNGGSGVSGTVYGTQS